MASETAAQTSKPPMTAPELIAFVKKELDADEERQAKVTPASTTELPTGSTLDLSHKNISALPVEVVLLIKDKVERLALSHNPRISIPTEIAQCDRLRYLNLRWNKLKHFPEAVLSLSKLEILDISKNAIDGIPEDIKNMTNLKFLAVARNQIKRLPLAIGEMNLVKLKFDENPIEFPPLDALQPSSDRVASVAETDKDKDMCQQVKRFMKAAALREKLRSHSEEDLSESNIETPRPPKRTTTGGRFPVRPSISGMESIAGPNGDSPPTNQPPPIPQRHHARVASSTLASLGPLSRRPGIAPLLTGNQEANRSRSETVATSANIRNRRQGYVPRKNTGLNSLSEMSSQLSARSTQAPTLTPPHSRAPSVSSNYLGVGSGNESSSGAVSPIDGSISRNAFSQRLASLPESRNSRLSTSTTAKAVKRGLLMLYYLNRPISDIAGKLSGNSPKRSRSSMERLLFTANAHVEELARLITNANDFVEDNGEINPASMAKIIGTAVTALKMYIFVIKELNRVRQEAIDKVDAFHIRCVITTAYSTIIEARNICHILGFRTKTVNPRDTLRASQAWSSRTVTPTQPKSAGSRRRGATILPTPSSSNFRTMAPPVPLNSGSRSNTMTSMSVVTPRYNESFTNLPTVSQLPSRTNTLRSVTTTDFDGEDGPDYVYFKLKACCDLANQTLPSVRADLASRKSQADRGGYASASKLYAQAVNKCDFVIATNNKLLTRLKTMKVGDTVRHQKEFLSMTENFGRDWTTFANQVVDLVNNRIDIGDIRQTLKPLQRAVKNANKAASQPPLSGRPPASAFLQGSFPSSINTGVAPASGQITPVPATPLGAALGPAVQATVPPTPVSAFGSPEYFPSQQNRSRPVPERTDTMIRTTNTEARK